MNARQAHAALLQLRDDLKAMMDADPDQEITGDALGIIDAALSAGASLVREHPLGNQVRDIFSPEALESGHVPRAAEVFPIVGQLLVALGQHDSENESTEDWEQLDGLRTSTYESNRGLFLVHTWKTSSTSGQTTDAVIKLAQHRDGPLTQGKIKSVQYTLGEQFSEHTVVTTAAKGDFHIEVSLYSPVLCIAKIVFNDDAPPLILKRYINI